MICRAWARVRNQGIEAFVAEFAVETLQITVLGRLARLDEVQGHLARCSPDVEREPGELWPVIHRNLLGHAVVVDELVEHADDPLPRK